MIKVEELTKRRGGRAVVSDVTFRCEPGTVTGFLGPNGAGTAFALWMLLPLLIGIWRITRREVAARGP
jgi:ABC-2 type transport system ATP-binding protein